MDIEQFQTQNAQDLPAIDTSTLFPDVGSQITDALAPFIAASVVLTVALVAIVIASALRRRKVERAILDIQKTLHEMNEREKLQGKSSSPLPGPRHSNKIIARPDQETAGRNTVS